jgi:hypothetical protein
MENGGLDGISFDDAVLLGSRNDPTALFITSGGLHRTTLIVLAPGKSGPVTARAAAEAVKRILHHVE